MSEREESTRWVIVTPTTIYDEAGERDAFMLENRPRKFEGSASLHTFPYILLDREAVEKLIDSATKALKGEHDSSKGTAP